MISRVAAQSRYPANFQLIAAMNPCPCGFLGSQRCSCTPDQINRYRSKISGPLLDRIDLQVQVSKIENRELLNQRTQVKGESNQQIQQRISAARERQINRQGKINNQLSSLELKTICPLNSQQQTLMDSAINRFRSLHQRLLSRTASGSKHCRSGEQGDSCHRRLSRGVELQNHL